MIEDILTIKSLVKSFSRQFKNISGKDENEQYWAINQLSLSVPKGKVIALIGGNGAGKTTLFNIISGFVKSDSGSISYSINNKDIELLNMAPHKIAQLGIGRMFQDNHIFPEMSVLDNMLIAESKQIREKPFMSLIFHKRVQQEEARRKLIVQDVFNNLFKDDNHFWEKREMKAGSLSYGQQRLLGLARLFMSDYNLILLDEPTAGVNPNVIEQIKILIRNFTKNNQTVLLIEHNLDVVQDIADFCCFMDQGRITIMGTPEDVIGNDEVRKSYIRS